MMEGIQPTYNMAERNGYCNGSVFGGEGIWLFAILALMWGGNGMFTNRGVYDGRAATVEDLASQSNFTRLEQSVMNNGAAIREGITNIGNGICNLGYQLATDFGELSKEISSCCCEMKQISLENRYLAAQNTAEINANVTAKIQEVKDLIYTQKAEAQAARINQLELNQAMCGVLRFPNSFAGFPFPYYGYGCGCGNNNNI